MALVAVYAGWSMRVLMLPNHSMCKTRLDILEDKVGGGDYASQERLSQHQLACCCKHNVLLN